MTRNDLWAHAYCAALSAKHGDPRSAAWTAVEKAREAGVLDEPAPILHVDPAEIGRQIDEEADGV